MVPIGRVVKTKTFVGFLILGIVAFVAYWLTGAATLSFLLIGPPIYISSFIRSFIASKTAVAPWIENWLILLPITFVYYSIIGFEISALRREKGWFSRLSILIVVLFLGYIHYKSWIGLSMYYIPRIITG